ncbi:unnamed protein product [Sphagnum tenellum]
MVTMMHSSNSLLAGWLLSLREQCDNVSRVLAYLFIPMGGRQISSGSVIVQWGINPRIDADLVDRLQEGLYIRRGVTVIGNSSIIKAGAVI